MAKQEEISQSSFTGFAPGEIGLGIAQTDHSLFLVDRFELDRFVRVLSSAGRATPVQILLYMMPAETTDLRDRTDGFSITAMQKDSDLPGSRKDKV